MRDRLLSSRWACAAFANISFPFFRSRSGVNPLVVYYHLVSDNEVPHVSNLYMFRSVSQFKRDMDVLLRFFHAVSLQDFLLSLNGQQKLPKNSFLLTFDDGLAECYEIIAPILKQKGIPATFLLCSAFVDNKQLSYDSKKSLLVGLIKGGKLSSPDEAKVHAVLQEADIRELDLVVALLSVACRKRFVLDQIAEALNYDFSTYLKTAQPYLTSDQGIELLKMGHSLGAHSVDHPRYQDLPLAEQIYQTRESVRFVKEQFSLDYGAFAFPHSDANVSKRFFCEVFEKTVGVDVCFGNHGLLVDSVPRNVQRTAMEKTWMPAEAILGKSFARRFVKSIIGQLQIARP
jgi:peptidoglycan/xylan/chitin deacetylase (PgdA/CDA1 family)